MPAGHGTSHAGRECPRANASAAAGPSKWPSMGPATQADGMIRCRIHRFVAHATNWLHAKTGNGRGISRAGICFIKLKATPKHFERVRPARPPPGPRPTRLTWPGRWETAARHAPRSPRPPAGTSLRGSAPPRSARPPARPSQCPSKFVTLDSWSVVASLLLPTVTVSPLLPRPEVFS